MEIHINDLFGFPWFSREVMERSEVEDVEYEDVTPPKEPTPEIIEDWTSENPGKPEE